MPDLDVRDSDRVATIELPMDGWDYSPGQTERDAVHEVIDWAALNGFEALSRHHIIFDRSQVSISPAPQENRWTVSGPPMLIAAIGNVLDGY